MLALVFAPASADVELKLRGLSDYPQVKQQLRAFLGDPPTVTGPELTGYVRDLEKRARNALAAIGYYNPDVTVSVKDDEADTEVRLKVVPGNPVRLRDIDIRLEGEAESDKVFQQSLRLNRLQPGDILNHGEYEQFKDSLVELAERRGYFDAEFTIHRVSVERSADAADIALTFASGVRYEFGRTTFDEGPIDAELLPLWLPFSPGTKYDTELITEATKALRETGYFSSVRIVLQRDQAASGRMPLHVELEPAAPNTVGLGVGLATDTGPRARVTWEKPYVNDAGHSLRSELSVSQVRSALSTSYRIPSPSEPARRYYQIEAAVRTEDFQDTRSTNQAAAIRQVRQREDDIQEDLYLRWLSETFEFDDERETTTMAIPGIGWSRTRRRGGLRPLRGERFGLRLEAASEDAYSEVDLQKVVASAKWLRPVLDRHYFIARFELGALATNDFERLPSSERFFAGGDQSVRGFAYRSIAPEDDDGTLIGGRYLTVGSVEFVWHFTPSWGVAVFTDSGRAFSDEDEPVRVGAGFGLRWRSPIGTLNADVAFGVSEDDVPARLHLLIGPEL